MDVQGTAMIHRYHRGRTATFSGFSFAVSHQMPGTNDARQAAARPLARIRAALAQCSQQAQAYGACIKASLPDVRSSRSFCRSCAKLL
jgi:hypothetical protein